VTDVPWGTPFHPVTNLPMPPAPLIGRTRDIAAVTKRLLRDDTQLLTLVGPPGIGKTSLSLAVAYDVLDEFADGVFLVLLASISDPDLVPRLIVQALGIPEIGPHSELERLKNHLRDKQMLLVLDNFEQILAAAPQIAELLAACPFVKFLVTSRAPLRIRRERQFPVPSLELPDLSRFSEVETLRGYAAVELFVERAQAVKPDFVFTQENGQSVAEICRRLDGLPLAIELLSARVKLLPPAALLERLHGRLLLQSDGLRDLEPRHRTLHEAIRWSYELLSSQEKTLFMQMGVFVSGCTLEAVETVCHLEISPIDGIASLLDKSLIQQARSLTGEPRYRMLETIREYALERLEESGEGQELRRRHANFFLRLAQTPHMLWLDRVEQDYDNLRAATAWCLTNDLTIGVHLTSAVGGFWIQRRHLIEGRSWLERYIEICKQSEGEALNLLCDLLANAGNLAYFQADLASVRQHAETLLALPQAQQDKANTAVAIFLLGQVALQQQDYERANTLFEQSLAMARQVNVLWHHTAATLLMLGLVAAGQKNYERAYALNSESLTLYRQLGDQWGESLILGNNASIWEEKGNYEEAKALCRQSLRLSLTLKDLRTFSQTLEQLAGLIHRQGEHERAVRLMSAAQALRDSIFAVIEPLDQPRHNRAMAQVRMYLDETGFATAWTEGRLMTLEQVVESALSDE
jgi:predicted ATPase